METFSELFRPMVIGLSFPLSLQPSLPLYLSPLPPCYFSLSLSAIQNTHRYYHYYVCLLPFYPFHFTSVSILLHLRKLQLKTLRKLQILSSPTGPILTLFAVLLSTSDSKRIFRNNFSVLRQSFLLLPVHSSFKLTKLLDPGRTGKEKGALPLRV